MLLLTLAAAGCQANCNDSDHFCYLYPLYQRLETSLMNDSQTLYALWQTFFPLHRTISPAISIKVCIEVGEIQSVSCNREGHSSEPAFSNTTSEEKCWWYQWRSSALLALITLMSCLPLTTSFSLLYIELSINYSTEFVLQPASLPCMPSSIKCCLCRLL